MLYTLLAAALAERISVDPLFFFAGFAYSALTVRLYASASVAVMLKQRPPAAVVLLLVLKLPLIALLISLLGGSSHAAKYSVIAGYLSLLFSALVFAVLERYARQPSDFTTNP